MRVLHPRVIAAGIALIVALAIGAGAPRILAAADTLPTRLTDQEFWALSQGLSEPDGYFRSDNLLSNEITYPEIMASLVQRTRPGAVYLGVGPEQNFNYIARLRPKMAFITDIRRENLHTQLMYKALFELAPDRVEFVQRLFSRTLPAGVLADASVSVLMTAVQNAPAASEERFRANLQTIQQHLTRTRALPVSANDLAGIEYVYRSFYRFGPGITYNSSTNTGRGRNQVTYAHLMTALDPGGTPQSYLASDASFQVMRDLHQRNLVVPVVGNFAGPRALRAVGQYVRDRGSVVSAFYLSNVEDYLIEDGVWNAFCANVATMPLDAQSTFIKSERGDSAGGTRLVNFIVPMQEEVRVGCGLPATSAAAP